MKKPTKAEIEKLAKECFAAGSKAAKKASPLAFKSWAKTPDYAKIGHRAMAEFVLTHFTRKVKRK